MKDLKLNNTKSKSLTSTPMYRGYQSLETEFWGERGEKLGRNDKCRCGSGQKFKRCCQPKTSEKSGKESVLKLVTGGSLGKELNKDGYVPYVVSWNKLESEEFKERYLEFLKVYPVLQGGCFFNSFKLMCELRDLGVEQVHGWYGFNVSECVEYEDWVDRYLSGKRGMEYVYDSSDSEHTERWWPGYDSVWDYDKGLVWKRHSWNKLDGVHFDTTRDTMNRDWVYYNEHFSQDWSDLLFSEREEKKVPKLLKSVQSSVQTVSLYMDDSFTLKGKKVRRKEKTSYQFS